MNGEDKKTKLSVHMILGASDYSHIKTSASARTGNDGEPVAEKTNLGWVIMPPGQELNSIAMMLTRSTQENYMQLCSLDVLGLSDHLLMSSMAWVRRCYSEKSKNLNKLLIFEALYP